MKSLEMLVLPSERGFQPPAPPDLSTLAKEFTATCPTRAWGVLTTVMVPCSICCMAIHIPAWMTVDLTKS